MKNKKTLKQILFFVLCLVSAGSYCVFAGQDINWDLLNYHLYTPFAFLNNRYGQDLFAAGIHSTMNPLLDVPYYLLFRALFHHPAILAFLQGLPYGLCVWLMYKIAVRVFEKQKRWWPVFTVVLAATAGGTFLQIGLATGEINNLVIILTSLWCFVIFVQKPKKVKFLYWAAFLAGFAAGCKLTASYYCIALFAALIPNIRQTEKPLKTVSLFCLLGAVGFLLTNGYFMWKWYSMYGSPFFPYYNNIFKSPYFDEMALIDPRFFPRNVSQWLFYPFYWVWFSNEMIIESRFIDQRLALGYIAAVVLAYRLLRGNSFPINRRLVSSLLILTIVSYIVWLCTFSIIRYACVIEFLACLLIFITLDSIFKKNIKIWLAILLIVVCFIISDIPHWPHRPFRKTVVEFTDKPRVEDNALVFLMHLPSSYLAVVLNPKATYMGGFPSRPYEYPKEYYEQAFLRNNLPVQYYQYHIEGLQREKIAKHEGPIYIVSIDWPMIRNKRALARYGLKPTAQPCQPLTDSWTIYSPPLAICPVEREALDEVK